MKVFLWSILQDALPLGENLQKRRIMTWINCTRCNERETSARIFFTCYFACEVWQNILISQSVHIAVDSNEDFEKIMLLFWNSVCFHPSGIVYKVLPWIFWPLWRDRNLLIFENRSLSSEEDSTKILSLVREWRWENKQKLIKNKPLPDLSRERSLGQATEPEIVSKSDASWDKTLKELDWLGFSQESTLVRLDKDTQPWILQTLHSWQKH